MKCILVDDDDVSRRVIEEFIGRTTFLEFIQSFDNAVSAFNYLKQGHEVHLIFLDIEMPEMTGIDLLNSLIHPPQVIIVSSKEKYALTAFEFSVTDYLLKPITYARFFKASAKALDKHERSKKILDTSQEIFIKKGSSLMKIRYSDILWVEALENYVVINTLSEKYTIHLTMKSIESQLPPAQFKRIHRSFIVNITQIYSIEDNSVLVKTTDGKRVIPIGKSFREKLLGEINLITK